MKRLLLVLSLASLTFVLLTGHPAYLLPGVLSLLAFFATLANDAWHRRRLDEHMRDIKAGR
jgi:hypothetical protein